MTKVIWGVAAILVLSTSSRAEVVWNVTQHSNGNIYFQTSEACKNSWCMVNPSHPADVRKNEMVILLTAKTTGIEVLLEWAGVTFNSDGTVPTYSSPSFIQLR